MFRYLGWIAAGGLGVGVAGLSLAYAVGRDDLRDIAGFGAPFERSCTGPAGGVEAEKPERRFAWTGGDSVDISLPATVRLRGGEGDEVVVRGTPADVANVEIRGNRIFLKCHTRRSGTIDITLPERAFRHIGISGSGDVTLENIEQSDLALRIGGSGALLARGRSDRVTVRISGSGRVRLADLAIKQLTVDISGSGSIEAAPADAADIKIAGAGTVRLLSRPPKLNTHVSGSGRLVQVERRAP